MLSDEEVTENLSANLIRLLQERGMSQSELARRSGENQPLISSIVLGKHLPNVARLNRIADALSVNIDRLLSAPPKLTSKPA